MSHIDAHVHVWTDDVERYPLDLQTKRLDMEPDTFLPHKIKAHARKSGVDRIVLIQMSYYGTDNSYMLDVIQSDSDTFRGVAIVDHRRGDLKQELRRLRSLGVRGFRIQITDSSAADSLRSGGYGELFALSAELDMAICPLMNPEYLPNLSTACSNQPETRIIIDHLARIGITGRIESEQVDHLCHLAQYLNVMVKVSAFYALGKKSPPHTDLGSLIHQVFEAFGPSRLMWGSDAPFQIQEETYGDSIALIRDHLDFLSSDDKDWILRRTAEATFFSS